MILEIFFSIILYTKSINQLLLIELQNNKNKNESGKGICGNICLRKINIVFLLFPYMLVSKHTIWILIENQTLLWKQIIIFRIHDLFY